MVLIASRLRSRVRIHPGRPHPGLRDEPSGECRLATLAVRPGRPAFAAKTWSALAFLSALLCLAAAVPAAADPLAGAGTLHPGEVSLPLKDYLALTESAERAEQARAAAKLHKEAPLAEVVAQRTVVEIPMNGETGEPGPTGGSGPTGESGAAGGAGAKTAAAAAGAAVGEGEARLLSEVEVLVQGHPQSPVELPQAGVSVSVEVKAAAAAAPATVDGGGAARPGLRLVAAGPGRYTVRTRSRARFASAHGESRVVLPRIVAPVAVLEVVLPAGLVWECPGAVVVDDRVEGGRRRLRLSAGRGLDPVLSFHHRVEGDQAAVLLAQDDVITILQLRPDGLRRHDVVLYEVSRGALTDLVVDLPPGFELERAGTDEGEVQPVVDGNRLIVHRQRRLQGSGYLVLTTRPPAVGGSLPVGLVMPQPPPRARYLAAATTVPGSLTPQPAASWPRVDLGDLPRALGDALAELDVTAAWRLQSEAAAGGPPPATVVNVVTAPQAAALETVVRRRLTTTLLTVDGILLHQDRFELAQAGEVLSLALPAGATLWSAAVDTAPVRPLVQGGNLAVPLGGGRARVVEVVAVLDKAIAKGRSRLAFELAQVQAPVLEHRWRLLLPESARYRFRAGDLRPALEPAPPAAAAARSQDAAAFRGSAKQGPASGLPAARDPWTILQAMPEVLVDRVNVGGNVSGQTPAYYDMPASPPGLHGRIVDQTGAALPGATVVAASREELPPQRLVTNASGEFAFPYLPPGTYDLKAELQGFSSVEYPGIRVPTREHGARVELTLSSVIEDVITVTSEAPLLDEKSIRTGASVSQSELGKVPPSRDPNEVLKDLRQGLVGGVKPLPVAVPETGKALLLAGVLPPARVAVELEVRSGGR
jgi:hypothetical protein